MLVATMSDWRKSLSAWTQVGPDQWAFAFGAGREQKAAPEAFGGAHASVRKPRYEKPGGVMYEIARRTTADGRQGYVPLVVLGAGVSKGITGSGTDLYGEVVYPDARAALGAVANHFNRIRSKKSLKGRYFPATPEGRATVKASQGGGDAPGGMGSMFDLWEAGMPAYEQRSPHEDALRELVLRERAARKGRKPVVKVAVKSEPDPRRGVVVAPGVHRRK